jgi:hypothetical protein
LESRPNRRPHTPLPAINFSPHRAKTRSTPHRSPPLQRRRTLASGNSKSRNKVGPRARSSAAKPGNPSESAKDSSPTLTPEKINTLVQTAIQGTNPIERRLAFDEILTSLDESTALAIRTALARNKAGGEQWRLFDYAWSAGDPTVVERNLPNTAEQHQKGFIADPVGAAEFVNNYEPGPVQDHFRNRLVEGLADNDIGMATDFVLEIANDNHPQAPNYIRTIAKEALDTKSPAEVLT